MTHHFFISVCLFSALLFASCSRTSLVERIPVSMERPQKKYHLEADSSFQIVLPETINPVALQIVADSILIIQNQPSAAVSQHFCAYSIRTNQLLGLFLTNGRSSGEILQPLIEAGASDSQYLFISDSSLGYAMKVDVLNSILTGTGIFVECCKLPDCAISLIPVSESVQVAYIPGKDVCFQTLEKDSIARRSFFPYRSIDGDRYITHLSSILTSSGSDGTMAEFMICFPELHILDINTGVWKSVAVDEEWRNWKILLNEPFSMSKRQYYAGATSSSDYIFASYWGCSLENCLSGGHGGAIHVLDWNGSFLFCLNVTEDIESIAFDSNNKHLYGLDRASGKIYRYDLSVIL